MTTFLPILNHIDPANLSFHGYGEIEFNKPLMPDEPVSRGSGRFWDIDESYLERTKVKPIQLHRIPKNN